MTQRQINTEVEAVAQIAPRLVIKLSWVCVGSLLLSSTNMPPTAMLISGGRGRKMANNNKNNNSQQKRRSSERQRIVKFIHVLGELVRRRLLVRESRLKYLSSRGVSQATVEAAASDSEQ